MAKKEKGFIAEFKKFIARGSVIDLAVGVIIGGAFQAIVNSLVNDIVMPLISLITKGVDFTNWFIVLGDGEYATLAEAQEAGAAVLSYGNFISAILNFIIMALVIFLIVKAINKANDLGKKEEPAPAPTTKKCPFCKSEIDIEATVCPFCTHDIPEEEKED
ncbi:MAG: large conductance mechanosensitive channel protein MscL [Clostridiales bacterium]|nr:large conductance mechanosensitive channel protein MscL [Clostridiales bacterium]